MPEGHDEASPFNVPRTIGGLVLLVLAALLFVLDYTSVDFKVDTVQLALILGTATVLLGVEAGRRLLGGGQ